MHLTIQVIYRPLVSTVDSKHITIDRILEVISNDDAMLTLEELQHIEKCAGLRFLQKKP